MFTVTHKCARVYKWSTAAKHSYAVTNNKVKKKEIIIYLFSFSCAVHSGGKDSCYNMMQCVAAGHTIVALANLRPAHTGKIIHLKMLKLLLKKLLS